MVKLKYVLFICITCVTIGTLCACTNHPINVESELNTSSINNDEENRENKQLIKQKTDVDEIDKFTSDYEFCCDACTDNYLYLEASKIEGSETDIIYYAYDLQTGKLEELWSPKNWSILLNPVIFDDSIIITKVDQADEKFGLHYSIYMLNPLDGQTLIVSNYSMYCPSVSAIKDKIIVEDYWKEGNDCFCYIKSYSPYTKETKTLVETKCTSDESGLINGEKISYMGTSNNEVIYSIASYNNLKDDKTKNVFYSLNIDDARSNKLYYQPEIECNYIYYDDDFVVVNRNYNGLDNADYHYYIDEAGDKVFIPFKDPHMRKVVRLSKDKAYIEFYLGGIILDTDEMYYYEIEDACTACNSNNIYFVKNNTLYQMQVEK